MTPLLGLALLAFVDARIVEPMCDDAIVHNIHHEKETLVDNKDSPYQLAIDYDTNVLFFSYSDRQSNEMFSSAYVNLKTNEFNTIPGIHGGFANAVDNQKHVVYLGGGDGLYEFDFDEKIAKHVDGTHKSIWQMFFKNNLYYTTYPEEALYVFKDRRSERVAELAHTKVLLVAVNKDLDYYFSNSSGLFKLSRSDQNTSLLGDYNTNGMTADNYGNIYFSTPDGIYYIDEIDNIEQIATIPNIYGLAIESDGGIIYASQESVIRLKPTKTPCYVNEKTNHKGNNKL